MEDYAFSEFYSFKDETGCEHSFEIPFVKLTNKQKNKIKQSIKQARSKNIKQKVNIWLNESQKKQFIEVKKCFFELIAEYLNVSMDELPNKLKEQGSIEITEHAITEFVKDHAKTPDFRFAKLANLLQQNQYKPSPSDEMIRLAITANKIEKMECVDEKIRCALLFENELPKIAVELYPDSFLDNDQNTLAIVITYMEDKSNR